MACFRYTTVDLHESDEQAAAYLVAWADAGLRQPESFTKAMRQAFTPSASEVAAIVPRLELQARAG
eukprot:4104268-Alexandrium_andersonii.AAC.1